MSEACEHFNGTNSSSAEEVYVQKERIGFCMDDGGVKVFDGDEEKRSLTVAIAGNCDRTHMAITRACFDKYCGQAPQECPFKKSN